AARVLSTARQAPTGRSHPAPCRGFPARGSIDADRRWLFVSSCPETFRSRSRCAFRQPIDRPLTHFLVVQPTPPTSKCKGYILPVRKFAIGFRRLSRLADPSGRD